MSAQPTTASGTQQETPAPAQTQTGIERLESTELAAEIEFLTARARSIGSGRANQLLADLDLKVRSYSVLSLACSGENNSPTS
jgi:hypothetical protein